MDTKNKQGEKTTVQQPAFGDRVRFNWGYHDAAFDVQRHHDVRSLVDAGPQTPGTVSKEYDPAYYAGYKYGIEDARHGRYQGDSRTAWERFKAERHRTKASVRFWEFVNDGWVKLTLKPGQQLRWYTRSVMDEGWQSETRTYLYDDGLVTAEIVTDGTDCDGRLQKYWKGCFDPFKEKKKLCYLGQNRAGENVYSDSMYYPEWRTAESHQVDHSAEAMGY